MQGFALVAELMPGYAAFRLWQQLLANFLVGITRS